MKSSKAQDCIEKLCADGCRAVYGYIRKLELGEYVPHTEHLNETEIHNVLVELKAIMSVYDEPDSCS